MEGIIKRGFFEVVERDACMLSHFRNKHLPIITNLPREILQLKEYIQRYNLEVTVMDASNELGVPTVICATIDRTGIGDAVNFGSSSAETYSEAIRKSILESIQCRRAGRITDILDPEYKKKKINPVEIRSVEDRYLYCKPTDRIGDVSSLIHPDLMVDYSLLIQRERDYKEIVSSFEKKGLSMYLSDVTFGPLVAKGFRTLKVTIPELLPLYIAEDSKALHSEFHGPQQDVPGRRTHLFT